VATSESRLELALAIVTAVAAMAWPARSRASTVAAVALLTVAGTAVRLTVGGYVAPGHVAGGALRLAELAVIVAATAGAWLVVRTPIRSAARRRFIRHHPPKSIVWLLAIGVAGAAFVIGTAPLHGRGIEPIAGFLHGRASQWSAAWRAFGDRPALGAGAGSFLAASARYQGPAPVRYAHDLPLEAAVELGVAGLLATVALYATTVAAAGAEALRRPSEAWLVVPGVVAFLVANLVDWEWDLPLSGAVWAVVLGGMIAAAPQAAQRERRR
jgi:O-antigen ligase